MVLERPIISAVFGENRTKPFNETKKNKYSFSMNKCCCYQYSVEYDIIDNKKLVNNKIKMAPREHQSERCLSTTSHDDTEANWNGQTGGQTDGRRGPRIESGCRSD